MKKYKIGYTAGVYDMFHIGHLNLLRRAKERCEFLIVGVTTDELSMKKKNKSPIIPYEERVEIVRSIEYVDKVIPQEDSNKLLAYDKEKFDVIFVGDDWKNSEAWNNYEEEFEKVGVDVVYFPYTKGTSSTLLREILQEKVNNK